MRLYFILTACLLAGCGSSSFDFTGDQSTDSETSTSSEAGQSDSIASDSLVDSSTTTTHDSSPTEDSLIPDTSAPADTAKEADPKGIACGLGTCAEGEVCCVSASISACKKSCAVGENTVACQSASDCSSSNPICCAQIIADNTCCFADSCGLSNCSGATVECYPHKIKTSVCQASACKSNYNLDMCSFPAGASPITGQACNSASECVTGSCCKVKGTDGFRICGTPTSFFSDCLK